MRYPSPLRPGDTIGVCAPSTGVKRGQWPRLDQAIENLRALGYEVRETPGVRGERYPVMADSRTRAHEFMSLWDDPRVKAIIPPWGGEFLMDMLPHLDFAYLRASAPKWVCGYSDLTTLTFALTLGCDIATIHGSNLMNLGWARPHPSDAALLTAMSTDDFTQQSAGYAGSFDQYDDLQADPYAPTQPSTWKNLAGEVASAFSGRVLGGCMDTVCKLTGTRFALVAPFLERYRADGVLWTFESCEMGTPDIYRTLWQMRQAGWFDTAKGFLFGRPDNLTGTRLMPLDEALRCALSGLGVPILYDADIGHVPPQMQLINGALASVTYADGRASVRQLWRA